MSRKKKQYRDAGKSRHAHARRQEERHWRKAKRRAHEQGHVTRADIIDDLIDRNK